MQPCTLDFERYCHTVPFWLTHFLVDYKACISRALEAASHRSTPRDIRLAIFCDGSFRQGPSTGGYAVVFNRYQPGAPDDHAVVGIGWPMDPTINNNVCEMVAIIQSIAVATTELEAIDASEHPGQPRPGPVSAVVTVFTDSLKCLEDISGHNRVRAGLQQRLLPELHAREAALLRLRDTVGMFVSVEYAWVPGHCAVGLNDMADELANHARQTNSAVSTPGSSLLPSVFTQLRHLFVEEQERIWAEQAEAPRPTARTFQGLNQLRRGVSNRIRARGGIGRGSGDRGRGRGERRRRRQERLDLLIEIATEEQKDREYARQAEQQLLRENGEAYEQAVEEQIKRQAMEE